MVVFALASSNNVATRDRPRDATTAGYVSTSVHMVGVHQAPRVKLPNVNLQMIHVRVVLSGVDYTTGQRN